jgi:hypothetical protein
MFTAIFTLRPVLVAAQARSFANGENTSCENSQLGEPVPDPVISFSYKIGGFVHLASFPIG